jgi:hypothetical protein
MFFEIQESPDFPAYAEDADISSLQAQETMQRQDSVAEMLTAYRPIEILDANGNRVMVLGIPQGQGQGDSAPWDLIELTKGEYQINVGRIFKSYGDAEAVYTIADRTKKFKPAAGNFIYLEVTNLLAPVVTLKSGPKWEKHPQVYEITGKPTVAQFKAARFLLWKFTSGTIPATERGRQISKNVWGKQIARSNDLILIGGAHEIDDASKRRIPVPVLVSL